jgi:hypothetical protein
MAADPASISETVVDMQSVAVAAGSDAGFDSPGDTAAAAMMFDDDALKEAEAVHGQRFVETDRHQELLYCLS